MTSLKAIFGQERKEKKQLEPTRTKPHILEQMDVERSRGSVGSHTYVSAQCRHHILDLSAVQSICFTS